VGKKEREREEEGYDDDVDYLWPSLVNSMSLFKGVWFKGS
jgi:hypothetical protein